MSGSLAMQTALAQDAQDDDGPSIETITVTAQKRTSDLQDTAISLSVLGNQQMEELNVNNFADYIKFLPTVAFENHRPGQAQLYMRGISSGGDGNHSASMPSVAVYLDEQPITTISEVLDLHMYDIARIEVLAGPQGTLFGASSQAGTVRIITNQPVIGEFSAGYDISGNSVHDGEMGYTLEGVVNIPVNDNMAIRLVAWQQDDGGYIDNVPHSITFAASGFTVNNDAFVEDDFNDVKTTGTRALVRVDLNENWTATGGITLQEQDSGGSFAHDPDDVGDLNTRVFSLVDYNEDWYQATMTVEGDVNGFNVVYAGAYLNRHALSNDDYIGYSEYLSSLGAYYGQDCYYYQNDGVSCVNPQQRMEFDENYIRQSHEFRVTTPEDNRIRAIGGLFYQQQRHDFELVWLTPDLPTEQSIVKGDHATWLTEQVRDDRDYGAFAEVSYDITENLTALGGVRYYKYNNMLYGFNGFTKHCRGSYVDGSFVQDGAGEVQYPCYDTMILDAAQKKNGAIFKANLSYTIDTNKMVYLTWSEGYRPGGVNRNRFVAVKGYNPDKVTNSEFGWKTQWMDNRLRFNGALYYSKWSDFQMSVRDLANFGTLTVILNVGESDTYGGEFDVVFAATNDLTLSLSGSYNQATLRSTYRRNIGDMSSPVLAAPGTEMPYIPKFKMTAVARQEFEISELPAYAQLSMSYSSASWNRLNTNLRERVPGHALVNFSMGVTKDDKTFSLFADNVLDNRAQLAINNPDLGFTSPVDTTIRVARPRMIGFRFGQKF